MRSLQPVLKLGRDVWDRSHLPVTEFRARAERVQDLMRTHDLGVTVLYGRTLDRNGHPTYLTHYTVKLPVASLVVLPRDDDPVLMFQGASRGLPAAQATTWPSDVRACGNVVDACVGLLRERDLIRGGVGLAGVDRLMPERQWRQLTETLGRARIVDLDDEVHALRAIKSPRELEQMRGAAAIVDRAIGSLATLLQPDSSERALEAAIVRTARLAGAEDVRVMLARPERSAWAFAPAERAPLDPGTAIAVSVAVAWERYWAEACRTFVVTASGFARHDPPGLLERAAAQLAAVKPDAPAGDVARRLADSVSAPAVELGHGIGTDAEEPPHLRPSDPALLAPGMCLVLRTVASDARVGHAVRSDTVVLRGHGAEPLTGRRRGR